MAPFVLKSYLKEKIRFTKIKYNSMVSPNKVEEVYEKTSGKTLDNYELYTGQEVLQNENEGITIYPSEYLCPRWNVFGEKAITKNTVAIHWNQSSWWGTKKDEKNIKEIECLRYNSLLKRAIYKNLDKITKIATLYILDKEKRKQRRSNLNKKIRKSIDKLL